LRILVDGDGDFGLRGAGGEQHQTDESNEEGTHFTFGLQALKTTTPLTVPQGIYESILYALNPALVPVACQGHR
jgi:hypothetical protein